MKTMLKVKTRDRTKVVEKADEQVMRVGIAALGITSCVIGAWAAVSFISGMISNGGPVSMAANWVKAIAG